MSGKIRYIIKIPRLTEKKKLLKISMYMTNSIKNINQNLIQKQFKPTSIKK